MGFSANILKLIARYYTLIRRYSKKSVFEFLNKNYIYNYNDIKKINGTGAFSDKDIDLRTYTDNIDFIYGDYSLSYVKAHYYFITLYKKQINLVYVDDRFRQQKKISKKYKQKIEKLIKLDPARPNRTISDIMDRYLRYVGWIFYRYYDIYREIFDDSISEIRSRDNTIEINTRTIYNTDIPRFKYTMLYIKNVIMDDYLTFNLYAYTNICINAKNLKINLYPSKTYKISKYIQNNSGINLNNYKVIPNTGAYYYEFPIRNIVNNIYSLSQYFSCKFFKIDESKPIIFDIILKYNDIIYYSNINEPKLIIGKDGVATMTRNLN